MCEEAVSGWDKDIAQYHKGKHGNVQDNPVQLAVKGPNVFHAVILDFSLFKPRWLFFDFLYDYDFVISYSHKVIHLPWTSSYTLILDFL